jgi:excisionase family DNA binding protein
MTYELLTTVQVAQRLNLSEGALRIMRHRQQGPAFVKIGRRIRYRPEDVDDFVERLGAEPTAHS